MRDFLTSQVELNNQLQKKLVEEDLDYGSKTQVQLDNNQAIASIYPQIQTIPSDIAVSLKRQRQLEYNKQLEAQVKAKEEKRLQDLQSDKENARKMQKEAMDRLQQRIDEEQKQRLLGNLQCVKMCETIQKTRDIRSQVEKTTDEFNFNVLHNGLYDNIPMKPMTELPVQGTL